MLNLALTYKMWKLHTDVVTTPKSCILSCTLQLAVHPLLPTEGLLMNTSFSALQSELKSILQWE